MSLWTRSPQRQRSAPMSLPTPPAYPVAPLRHRFSRYAPTPSSCAARWPTSWCSALAPINAIAPSSNAISQQSAAPLRLPTRPIKPKNAPRASHTSIIRSRSRTCCSICGSIAAALLHDVVEDTSITKEQVELAFGREVAHLVDGVTKLSALEAQTKEEAQVGTYRKMFIAMADDPRVVLVKLADRLHNMRTIGAMKAESQKRIARETLDIYAPLAHRLGIWQMKWELEDKSFAVLNPEKYQEISRQLALRRDARERIIQRVIARLPQAYLLDLPQDGAQRRQLRPDL